MVRLDMGKCCELRGYHGEPSWQRDTAHYWHGDACRDRTQDCAARHRHKTRISSTISARGAESLTQWAAATVVVVIFSWNGGGITALQQEMLITSTITQSDYSHLHKNVSYLLRDLGAEYPMYLYHHKTRFKFIFLIKQNPNRQCRLADEKIF